MNPVFHVLTEFKFEIGHAMTSSKTLTSAVEDLSLAADQALFSFQKMSMGLVAHLGLGSGGVLGTLYEAIQASEKFEATQRKLANIFMSNQGKIAGGPISFMEAMSASNDIMSEIQRKAREFALPVTPLANMTALLGAPMFGAGAGGNNLAPAIDIARGVLKSAPVLGVDANQAQSEVVSMILGRGNIQDQFVNRIVADTDVFRKLLGGNAGHGGGHGQHGGALGAFNALSVDKRVKVLTEALLQFASSTEIVEANAKSLTQQMQVLRDTFSGMFSILRPIGESISRFLAPNLIKLNAMIQTNGAAISQQLGTMLSKALGDPETLFANLFQMKSLKRDLDSTSKVFSMAGAAGIIGWGLSKLGMGARLASPWVAVLGGAFEFLFDIFMRTPTIGTKVLLVGAGIAALIALLVAFPPVAGILATATALTALFQLFSRAEGIAHIDDAKVMPQLTEDLTRITNAVMTTFGRLMSPFTAIFEGLAQWISPLFRVSGWIGLLNQGLFTLAYSFSFLEGVISGMMESIKTFMTYFTSSQMISNPRGIFGEVGKSFNSEYDRVMKDNLSSLSDPEKGAVVKQIININDVNINNSFKENMEPDRIAFTLVDQLRKVAQNPVSNPGRSMGGALTR